METKTMEEPFYENPHIEAIIMNRKYETMIY